MKQIYLAVALIVAAIALAAGTTNDLQTFTKSVNYRNADGGYMTFASNCVTDTTDSGNITHVVPGVFPARVLPLGLTYRVNTVLAGASLGTISIGDGTDADLYGAGLAKTAGTTAGTAQLTARPTTQAWSTSAGDITLTGSAGVFTSGEVTICGHYATFTAPTS